MSSFEELLAARKSAPPRTAKVSVLLDVDAAEEIAELESQLEALSYDKRLAMDDGSKDIQAQIDALRERSSGAVVDLVFERLPGDLWTDITIRHPARLDASVDVNYGYNLDDVSKAVAKAKRGGHSFAWRLEGGSPAVLTDEQWEDVFTLMSGHEFNQVRDAIFILNEFGPAQRLAEAKKGSAGDVTGSN